MMTKRTPRSRGGRARIEEESRNVQRGGERRWRKRNAIICTDKTAWASENEITKRSLNRRGGVGGKDLPGKSPKRTEEKYVKKEVGRKYKHWARSKTSEKA